MSRATLQSPPPFSRSELLAAAMLEKTAGEGGDHGFWRKAFVKKAFSARNMRYRNQTSGDSVTCPLHSQCWKDKPPPMWNSEGGDQMRVLFGPTLL